MYLKYYPLLFPPQRTANLSQRSSHSADQALKTQPSPERCIPGGDYSLRVALPCWPMLIRGLWRFFLFDQFKHKSHNLIGQIVSIWVKKCPSKKDYYLKLKGFELGGVDQHYQMRSLICTANYTLVHITIVSCHVCFLIPSWRKNMVADAIPWQVVCDWNYQRPTHLPQVQISCQFV
jgi:hypothetical protein